jgi:allantoinase
MRLEATGRAEGIAMALTTKRDLIGYGEHPPRVEWPGGARLALNIALNFEEGSERSPLLGDPRREERSEFAFDIPPDQRDLMQESTYEYGSRVGHWRVVHLLDEFKVTCTIFAAAQALELHPEYTAAFKVRGYDIVGHGYRWMPYYGMDLAAERHEIRLAIDSIERLTGQRITGWFNRPPVNLHSQRAIAEEGLLFDSTALNDDLPYYAPIVGRPLLILPYSFNTNDMRFWQGAYSTANDFYEYCRDAFDALYDESATVPRMMSVGLHGRVIGAAGRINGLRRFLEHVSRHEGVWIAPRSEIARVWSEQFAPPDAWNWTRATRIERPR